METNKHRNTKIIATLGPASSNRAMIERLALAGANVFRLNFSHGSHAEHQARLACIREVESSLGRPIGILADLQGPKLRLGVFANEKAVLKNGDEFVLDMQDEPGTQQRVTLPHAEIFAGLQPGHDLLIDDGKVRLRVLDCDDKSARTLVVVGGTVSNRKGVNLPQTALPLSALTPKDREDLAFALAMGVDWVALSFVQRPEDVLELRELVQNRAGIVAKIEKPLAIQHLDDIVIAADAVMVARGDLGVEVAAEEVPLLQRQIIRSARNAGKPVIVATQMLESMVHSPAPTRAETSDVATAVYDAVDAVMLSAESAAGDYPEQAVEVMQRVIGRVESDPLYRETSRAIRTATLPEPADAIGAAVKTIAEVLPLSATVTYTTSGASALRIAHERPRTPILGLTPRLSTARRLTLTWGVHPVLSKDASNVEEMVLLAKLAASASGFTDGERPFAIVAGMPFGTSGSTNLLRMVWPESTLAKLSQQGSIEYKDSFFAGAESL
jgi:pyruvate kinase